jgi:hypothetical protein
MGVHEARHHDAVAAVHHLGAGIAREVLADTRDQ